MSDFPTNFYLLIISVGSNGSDPASHIKYCAEIHWI